MKTKENNRNKKWYSVEYFISKNPQIDPHDKNGQNEILKYLTHNILLSKIKKNIEYRFEFTGSANSYRTVIDSYERALASLNLFLFRNKISSNIGYTYIISNKSFPGYYKIGYSQDAEHRLQSYQTCSPFKDYVLEKYLISKDAKQIEQEFLKLRKSDIVNGEWLKLNDDETIDSVFKNSVCSIAHDLGFYNRFSVTKSSKLLFDESENLAFGEFYGLGICDVLDDFYKNHPKHGQPKLRSIQRGRCSCNPKCLHS